MGDRRKVGRCPTGMVYEETLRLVDEEGGSSCVRRVTIELKKPTRNGESEIGSDEPAQGGGRRSHRRGPLSAALDGRKAFHELDQRCTVRSRPWVIRERRLLSFCVAFFLQCDQRGETALNTVHGAKPNAKTFRVIIWRANWQRLSRDDDSRSAEEWTRHFASLSAAELARILKNVGRQSLPRSFSQNVRGPKKPPPSEPAPNDILMSLPLRFCYTQHEKPCGASLKDWLDKANRTELGAHHQECLCPLFSTC